MSESIKKALVKEITRQYVLLKEEEVRSSKRHEDLVKRHGQPGSSNIDHYEEWASNPERSNILQTLAKLRELKDWYESPE